MARDKAKQRKPKPGGRGSSSLKRWNTHDDIPDDEQDAFHRQQDMITLGDAEAEGAEEEDDYGALAGQRGILDVDEDDMDSEVDEEEEGEEDEEDYEDEEVSMERDGAAKGKAVKKKATAALSDEEDEDEYEEGADDAPSGGWGPNKQSYYSTNDLDDLSSDSEMDEEEKREMELREVKKLQSKSRQGMMDEDFGLGQDAMKLEGSSAAREARKRELNLDADTQAATLAAEPLDPTSLDALQRAELMSKVQKSTPETLALVGEYADIVEEIDAVSNRLKDVMGRGIKQEVIGLCCLHHQTLLTYATNLTFYFYLRATPYYAQNPEKLSKHPVIGRLLKLKTGLQVLDSFGLAVDGDDDESVEGDGDEENRAPNPSFLFKTKLLDGNEEEEDDESLGSLEDDELMQLDSEERESEATPRETTRQPASKSENGKGERRTRTKGNKKAKVTTPLAHVAELDDEDDSLGAMKKRRKGSLKSPALTSTDAEAFNAFGEPLQLSASDSADKEARRKSLKFYTGQIDARDARKAGGSGLGGDSDIPYRDRERSRMAVADANSRKAAGREARVMDRSLDGDEWGENDTRDWKDVMDVQRPDLQDGREGVGEGPNDSMDYYDLVASGKKAAKRARKEEYDEIQANQRIAPDDTLEEGEHRGINRAIEKNKGLTPRRPKSVRNPRVKKRLRYEKAKKKLSSKGPVYKGGQAALQGGYSGEKSGINSNVVKSRQFA